MKRTALIPILFLLILSSTLLSQTDPAIQKIIDLGKSDNHVMYYQDILCNRIGGRLTGTDQYLTACYWAMNELKNMGLKVELDEVGEVPVGFLRGHWSGKMIKPSEKVLEFVTPSYTAGTKGIQSGPVVIMPKTDAGFDSVKSKMNGSWILIEGENSGWPRDRDSVVALTRKLTEAGALGTIQLTHVPIRTLDSRCVKSWDALPTLCDIKLLDTQYNEIKSLVEKGEEVILEFEIRNFFKPGPIKYYNVIGTLPGTKFPNEYVIISGHLDSFDIATGAIDNGSGVSTMMEAIRLMTKAGAKPKRSIMIHLYASEEQGLVGSKSWVNKNKKLLGKISLVINKDSGTNPAVSMGVPKVMFDDVKKIAEPIETAGLKYPFAITESQPFRKAGRGGTDSFSFIMEGVPAPGLRLQGPHQYGRTWHTPLDTYNEVIPDAQQHSSIVVALLAYGAANLDHLLNREGAFIPDGIYADLNTNKGRITLKLDYEHVPMTVANFVGLAEGKIKNDAIAEGKPYFSGSIWHRVVPGFVIQAGMPVTGKETEGPGYEFPNEIYKGLRHNKAGMLGMANAGPHTNGSQFYITLSDYPHLDGRYTVFGSVDNGMDVVNKIVQGDTIKSVTISRIGQKAIDFKVTTDSFKKMVEEAKTNIKNEEEKRLKKESDLIKKNFSKAKESTSGLKYIILKNGTGNKPVDGTVLKVQYKGIFLLGAKKFASIKTEGNPDIIKSPETFEYIVGKTKINPALDETLRDMKKGETRKVIALSKNAYGENAVLGKRSDGKKYVVIPPNTSLIYEIEIIQ